MGGLLPPDLTAWQTTLSHALQGFRGALPASLLQSG